MTDVSIPPPFTDQKGLPTIPVGESLERNSEINYFPALSDNDYIIKRSQHRVRCNEFNRQNPLKQNKKFEIRIPRTNRSLVPSETYFTFRVRITGNSFNTIIKGSVQRLIKRMTIMDGHGQVLEDINDYNQITECLRNTHFSKDFINDVLEVEGIHPTYRHVQEASPTASVQLSGLLSFGLGSATVTGFATEFRKELKPGDRFFYYPFNFSPEIASITSDTQLELSALPLQVGTNVYAFRAKPGNEDTSYANVHANLISTNGHVFAFQPYGSGLMNADKHIPLWATNGMRIQFTMDSDANSLIDEEVPPANPTFEILEVYCHYTTVHYAPRVQRALETVYEKMGLRIVYESHYLSRRESNDIPGQRRVEEYNEGFGMLNDICHYAIPTANVDNILVDSFQPIRLDPKEWFLEMNGVRVPDWGVENRETSRAENYMEYLRAMGRLGNYDNLPLLPWREHATNVEQDPDSQIGKNKYYYRVNLETYPKGVLTGVDSNAGKIKLNYKTDITDTYEHLTIFTYSRMLILRDARQALVQA